MFSRNDSHKIDSEGAGGSVISGESWFDRYAEYIIPGAAAFLLLWGLGSRTLWSSEGRWAEITREMFLSGDFFHPTIGGEPYFDKPLITYWAIAGLKAATGRLDEFIVRLPSAIAALIALACTMFLGKRLWSRKVGMLAGGLLLTSYGFLMYSRIASAETENLAAIVLAVTWYWMRREKPGFASFVVFYLIMFVGAHMKGLTAFVVPVLVILPDLLREKRWKWLFWPSHLMALGIGMAVYLAPFIYAAMTNPEGYGENGLLLVFQENIIRYVRPYDHEGPIYLYLGVVPLLTVPWAPLFIGAVIASVKSFKTLSYNTRWLISAIALIFIFFTISGSRRNYYILPILPFCMLLMSIFLEDKEIIAKKLVLDLRNQKYTIIIAAVLEMLIAPLVVFYLIYKMDWELPALLGWSFMIVGAAALLPLIIARYATARASRPLPRIQPIWMQVAMSAILMGGFFAWQYSILDMTRTEQPFALQMKTVAQSFPHERVAFWKTNPDKQLFYMDWDLPVTMLRDEQALENFVKDSRPGLVIAQSRYITETVAPMFPSKPAYEQETRTWETRHRKNEKRLNAWIVNPYDTQIVSEERDVNYAE